MDLFSRHRNLAVLVLVLFAQVIGLAVQVKRPTEAGPVRLIRLWGINLITPAESGLAHGQDWFHDTWRNYFYLRDVRRENERLREENTRLRLEQVRTIQDASQAQRLQALLKFKEQFISQTVAAQVIGSSGSEQSRLLYIDKGASDGIAVDMAVIAPTGIIGKVIRVFPTTAQVLEINDQSSGVGAILEKSRLQGVLKGTAEGGTTVRYIMSDEKVEPGEMVLTSGGDRIFPKGLTIGRVIAARPGPDGFLNVVVKPGARLDRVEELLVITRIVEKERELVPEAPMRASDILAQRLPAVPPKPPAAEASAVPGNPATNAPGSAPKPAAAAATAAKTANAKPPATGTGVVPNETAAAKPGTLSKPKPANEGTKTVGSAAKPSTPQSQRVSPVKPETASAGAAAQNRSASAGSGADSAKTGGAKAQNGAQAGPDPIKPKKPVAQNQVLSQQDNPQ